MQQPSYIYGIHAVEEALKGAPHVVKHVWFLGGIHETIKERARAARIPAGTLDARDLPRPIERDAVHQGVIAQIEPGKLMQEYRAFVDTLSITPATGLIVLGELTDPHNVGAVIRSAAAFSIAGVLIPEHRQAPVTGAVVKVSAGMAFRIPLVTIGNVNSTLDDLKDRGFWVYGLASSGSQQLQKEAFTKPSVFVLGSEGAGMREKTEAHCDITLSIPIDPQCESLNAAASAAVTLYAWQQSVRSVQ